MPMLSAFEALVWSSPLKMPVCLSKAHKLVQHSILPLFGDVTSMASRPEPVVHWWKLQLSVRPKMAPEPLPGGVAMIEKTADKRTTHWGQKNRHKGVEIGFETASTCQRPWHRCLPSLRHAPRRHFGLGSSLGTLVLIRFFFFAVGGSGLEGVGGERRPQNAQSERHCEWQGGGCAGNLWALVSTRSMRCDRFTFVLRSPGAGVLCFFRV